MSIKNLKVEREKEEERKDGRTDGRTDEKSSLQAGHSSRIPGGSSLSLFDG